MSKAPIAFNAPTVNPVQLDLSARSFRPRVTEREPHLHGGQTHRDSVLFYLDFKTYKKFAEELAWETEVWIAEMPEHMIHLNGDKFMGPR